jgi:hypothetical protein
MEHSLNLDESRTQAKEEPVQLVAVKIKEFNAVHSSSGHATPQHRSSIPGIFEMDR